MKAPRQLPLPLPARSALGREDFFVTPANAMAVALIEGWQHWPARKCLLTGPEGSGKTHLAHVWAALSDARILAARDLPDSDIPALACRAVCAEDADAIAGDRVAEEALFHLHNLVLAEGQALLITAQSEATRWGLSLPDLQSRMMGTQAATLAAPDDTLLTALLAKLFDDRQIVPAPDVIPYLVGRMPRSHAAARAIADRLNAQSLAQKRGITRPMASAALESLGMDGQV